LWKSTRKEVEEAQQYLLKEHPTIQLNDEPIHQVISVNRSNFDW